jgi:7-cyano-7-deazaguanine synthase
MKAVVLLSGGLDSSTVLYRAKSLGIECYALSFDYAQRHQRELTAAKKIAELVGVAAHRVVEFDLRSWGGSALTDPTIGVPTARSIDEMAATIPVTYVPARNTIFLSFALAYAEAIEAQEVHIGVNALDYSGYPDCRPDYIAAMQEVFRLGTRQGREGKPIEIVAPLVNLNKAEIIRLGNELNVPWESTWSCYQGGDRPCGQCDSCLLRNGGFQANDLLDPVLQ